MSQASTFISDGYEARVTRQVPGLADLHRMSAILLDERVPERGEVLVLGAGGGLELDALSRFQPDWRLYAIDPSRDMLDLARARLAETTSHIRWLEGYIHDAEAGPYDGAICLLTLHFLTLEERIATLKALRDRLKPDAPLIVAHHSFDQDDASKTLWLQRNAALMVSAGFEPEKAQAGIGMMKRTLPTLSPGEDEAVLKTAGFTDPTLFYAGFTFRGWVVYRSA